MITVTTDNFHSDILLAKGIGILVFVAGWCIPSRKLLDILRDIEPDFGNVVIGTVDIENEPVMVRHWLMRESKTAGSPTMIAFHKGEPTTTRLGAGTEEQIRDWITEQLGKAGL